MVRQVRKRSWLFRASRLIWCTIDPQINREARIHHVKQPHCRTHDLVAHDDVRETHEVRICGRRGPEPSVRRSGQRAGPGSWATLEPVSESTGGITVGRVAGREGGAGHRGRAEHRQRDRAGAAVLRGQGGVQRPGPGGVQGGGRRISRNGGEGLALSGDVSVEADVLANIAAAPDGKTRRRTALVLSRNSGGLAAAGGPGLGFRG